VARPSNILLAGEGEQRDRYLCPASAANLGLPGDDRARRRVGPARDEGLSAREEGGDFVLNGTKHFISHADVADFAIVFMATGEEDTPRGRRS
jgi:acyl-CoA dehydrogenase